MMYCIVETKTGVILYRAETESQINNIDMLKETFTEYGISVEVKDLNLINRLEHDRIKAWTTAQNEPDRWRRTTLLADYFRLTEMIKAQKNLEATCSK